MWKRISKRRVGVWIVYLVVLIAVILIHYRGEIFETGCGSLTWTAKVWHQRLCMAGHRKPRTHYVTLITLTQGLELQDKCQGRRFMASLLRRLRDLNPSLIIVDKWYLPGGCTDIEATAALQSSVSEVSKTVPVILARSSDLYEELQGNNDPDLLLWKSFGLGDKDEVLSESAIAVDGKDSQLGLARLACNTWEIPLQFDVYPPLHSLNSANKYKTPVDALAFAATKKFDHRLAGVMSLHVEKRDALVGAFLPLAAFDHVSGNEILCSPDSKYRNGVQCNSIAASSAYLRGRIALIGEYSKNDTHESVIGSMPGFVLQANYIESLLDDRYFQLIPKGLEIFLTIVCLAGVDIVIERYHHWGGLASLAGVVLLWGIAHFAIMEWGFYFTFWFPAALGIVAKWLEIFTKLLHKQKSPSTSINQEKKPALAT